MLQKIFVYGRIEHAIVLILCGIAGSLSPQVSISHAAVTPVCANWEIWKKHSQNSPSLYPTERSVAFWTHDLVDNSGLAGGVITMEV